MPHSSWVTIKLEDAEEKGLVELGRGKVISRHDMVDKPGNYPVYSSSAQGDGEFGRMSDYMFDEELITWSIDGGGRLFYRPKGRFSVTNVCGWLRSLSPNIDLRFLHASLDFQRSKIAFDYQSKAHPSVIRKLYDVMIPPLPEQRQIAEILSSVDEAIHATGAVIEQTRVVKYGVLDRLMTKENGGVNFSTGPVSTCESWSETTLGAICVDDGLQTGPFGSQLKASEYVDAEVAGAVAVVMPQDLVAQRISTRKIARTSQEKAALLSRHRLIEGDIMFGRRGDIGRAALVTKTEAGFLCGTGCLRARLKKETADPFYVMAWLGTERSQKWLNEHAVGQTMLNLNTKIIGSLPVSLPSMSAQMNVRQGLQHFEGTLDDLLGEIATLRAFKSALMSDLLTGRKRVTDTMALAAE